MSQVARLIPASVEGRMVAILTVSFVLLLSVLVALEFADRESAIEWAESNYTLNRVERLQTVLESITAAQRADVLDALSECHDGYTLTQDEFAGVRGDARTALLEQRIATALSIDRASVAVGYAKLGRDNFSYGQCSQTEIDLPMVAIVISLRLASGEWFNTEVHPHEWHLQDLIARLLRYSGAFILVAVLAIFLIRKLSQPLNNLTEAAQRFADGLNVSPVAESGPADLRRAIASFNAMQQQVADDVKRRTDTLASISHDLRTPLTAMRIRAEMVEDDETRQSLVTGIDKMEKIISSALEFLRGESRCEPRRTIDLGAMLTSECDDLEETGQQARYVGETSIHCVCRSEALARAVRNLIENANKYADGATVDLRSDGQTVDIQVSDEGPGIPADKMALAVEPFRRLSSARESDQGGFGLGLAIVLAIAKGHDGELILEANEPTGLVAIIRLPLTTA